MSSGNTKRNWDGNVWALLVDWGGRLIPGWKAFAHLDESSADNDWTKGMDSDQRWNITSITVEYTATATVGNRRLVLELSHDSQTYLIIVSNQVIAASQTITVVFGPGMQDYLVTGSFIGVPTPELWVPEAGGIRVYDIAAIDNADTFDVHVAYHNYPEVP